MPTGGSGYPGIGSLKTAGIPTMCQAPARHWGHEDNYALPPARKELTSMRHMQKYVQLFINSSPILGVCRVS